MFIIGFVAGIGVWMAPQASGARELTLTDIMKICDAVDVEAARQVGDQLSRKRMTPSELSQWQASSVTYNKGAISAVTWKAGKSGIPQLSFWMSRQGNPSRVCSYSTVQADRLKRRLTVRFGKPKTAQTSEARETAFWPQADGEIIYRKADGIGAFTYSRNL